MACAISRALGRDPVGVSPFTAGQFVEQALSAIGLVIMANFVELLTAVADELAGPQWQGSCRLIFSLGAGAVKWLITGLRLSLGREPSCI